MNLLPFRSAAAIRLAAAALVVAGVVTLGGCSQLIDVFNGAQGAGRSEVQPVTPSPMPSASASLAFGSQFTLDGSVSLVEEVAPDLDLTLDVWAANPRRTGEWTPEADKTFGFAVNVYDRRVDEKAVLAQKRRVYISSITITSQTAQTSGQVQQPFQFSADPRSLVPSDTLRSDRGLLLNSFQGGLHVPETTIRQLPNDTYGITLQFAMTVSVEQMASTEGSFQEQTVYRYLPIAITLPAAAAG